MSLHHLDEMMTKLYKAGSTREMEYIERASFVEIYGLELAYAISLLIKFFNASLTCSHGGKHSHEYNFKNLNLSVI